MFSKGVLLVVGIAAGAMFGVGLGIGVIVGTQWSRVTHSLQNRGVLGKRKQIRYGALQQ